MSKTGEDHFQRLANRYSTLPFVEVDAVSEKVSLWSVKASGKWQADFEAGASYARALVAFMLKEDAPYFLGNVLDAMRPGLAKLTGIEAGFTHQLSVLAIKGS